MYQFLVEPVELYLRPALSSCTICESRVARFLSGCYKNYHRLFYEYVMREKVSFTSVTYRVDSLFQHSQAENLHHSRFLSCPLDIRTAGLTYQILCILYKVDTGDQCKDLSTRCTSLQNDSRCAFNFDTQSTHQR